MKKFLQEFKDFAIKGNMVDLAVGVIVGGAFNSIVSSLVTDIFTPAIAALFGSTAGLSGLVWKGINFGNFINAVINFLVTAFCLFLVVRTLNAMRKPAQPAAAPEPSDEVKLLTEIRDQLKQSH
jgi:large conductance mechanosensitive channel